MTLSDKIQLATCIVTALIGIISVAVAIFTLKANNKMIEESTRPYLVFFTDMVNTGSNHYYIILKNFGTSGATINSLATDFDLNKLSLFPDSNENPFSNMKNTFIAPGQKLYTTLFDQNFKDLPNELKFTISYTSTSGKKYSETFNINFNSLDGLALTTTHIKNQEHAIKTIATSIQGYINHQL